MKKLICFVLSTVMLLAMIPLQAAGDTLSEYAYGDVDQNGCIDAGDALAALQGAVGKIALTPRQRDGAEVSGDGQVTAVDGLEILRYAVGEQDLFTANRALKDQTLVLKTAYPDQYASSLWQKKIKEMEDRYSMTLTIVAMEQDEQKTGVSADDPAHILEVPFSQALRSARENQVVNFADLPLHASAKNNPVAPNVTVGNWRCGVGMTHTADTFGIFYNKERVAQYASGYDLEALYADKGWTLDTLQAVAKLCTADTNGDNRTDIFGITGNTQLLEGMAMANDGGYATMKEGRPVFSYSKETANYCKKLFSTDLTWNYMASEHDCFHSFAKGEAAMVVTHTGQWEQVLANADFEVGFLPMPIGFAQDGHLQAACTGNAYVVPAGREEKAVAVTVLLNEFQLLTDDLLAAREQSCLDGGLPPRDARRLIHTVSSATQGYCFGLSAQSLQDLSSRTLNPCKCLQHNFIAIANRAQAELDEFYAPFYE